MGLSTSGLAWSRAMVPLDEGEDGCGGSALVRSPGTNLTAAAKTCVGTTSSSSGLGVLLFPVKAQRCFYGFGKLIRLLAEPEVLNGDVGLLPSGVVLSVLRTEALFWKCWGILKDPSKSRFG